MALFASRRSVVWFAIAVAVALAIVAAAIIMLVMREPRSAVQDIGDATTGAGRVATGSVPASVTTTPPGPSSSQGKPVGVGGTFVLRVQWWNDTEKRGVENAVLTWGTDGSWSPDPSKKSQVTTIGPFPVGKSAKVVFYPDGKAKRGDTLSILVRPDMVSDSEQDSIHIEVTDTGVRMLGNPVENIEQVYSRP